MAISRFRMLMISLVHPSRRLYLFLAILAGLLYANTLGHGFVMDDEAVILKNQYVKQGMGGIPDLFMYDTFSGFESIGENKSILEGGRYRPLSLVFFAILFSFFGENAWPFHLFNIVLYILTGLLVFRMMEVILKEVKEAKWIALLTAVLFIVHPVHTEVVANCKSADELLSFLFGLLFLLTLFQWYDQKKMIYGLLSPVFFLLACLAKESAITFVVTAPLAIWYARRVEAGKILVLILPGIIAAIVYLLIRHQVLGIQVSGTMMHDPMNHPFLQWDGRAWVLCEPIVKMATLLFVFAKYAGLMVFPFPLTHDYYPFHIQLQTFASPMVWMGLILFVAMTYVVIKSIRHKQLAGFGLLFFLVSLVPVSNLFFPVGTFMAERFLYLPSFGLFMAFSATIVPRFAGQSKQWILGVVSIIVVLFAVLTVQRNTAWKSNETLVLTDVQVAPNSAKLQLGAGTILLTKALAQTDPAVQKQLLDEALPHLRKSMELHPTYYDAHLAYGACAYYLQDFDSSVEAYREMAQQHPGDEKSLTGLRYALHAKGNDDLAKGDTASSMLALEQAWNISPDTAIASVLAAIYQSLHKQDTSRIWLERARQPVK